MSDASLPHCPHCNEPMYSCECSKSDKMTDEDIDAELLDREETGVCPHDRPLGECNACDVAGDFGFDADRERN